VKAEFITKNPATDLDAISEGRPKTDPFTREELAAIIEATDRLADGYGRCGGPIAKLTRAFVLVMRYTGLSIGDTAKLRKDDVVGCRVRTSRKKTGEDVFARVPQFVIDALNEAPHDSPDYFFWTGAGKLHTRASKWGERLQRLFVLADVQTEVVEKRRRSGGVLKDSIEQVKISRATPHQFRHTLARDLLEGGTPIEEVAELLGNDVRTAEKYYSKWDVRRQARLEKRLEDFWESDPLTQTLSLPAETTRPV
jgi:integrase